MSIPHKPYHITLPVARSFEFAFDIAKVALKSKLPEIHLKYALYFEDEVSSTHSHYILPLDHTPRVITVRQRESSLEQESPKKQY